MFRAYICHIALLWSLRHKFVSTLKLLEENIEGDLYDLRVGRDLTKIKMKDHINHIRKSPGLIKLEKI